MTGAELKAARHRLDLTAEGFAAVLQVGSGDRQIRRWENLETRIPGPVSVLVNLLLTEPAVRRRLGLKLNPPD